MNNLNCFRSLSLSRATKGSKPGSSKEKNIYDVAIVGGGAMGSSAAYFLASRMRMTHAMGKICVIERDPTVSKVNEVYWKSLCFLCSSLGAHTLDEEGPII